MLFWQGVIDAADKSFQVFVEEKPRVLSWTELPQLSCAPDKLPRLVFDCPAPTAATYQTDKAACLERAERAKILAAAKSNSAVAQTCR